MAAWLVAVVITPRLVTSSTATANPPVSRRSRRRGFCEVWESSCVIVLPRPEDNRPVLVDEDAVFEMPVDGSRENGSLDVAPDHRQHLGVCLMRHAPDILLDDRAFVELLGRVVGRRSDELDSTRVRADVWVCPGESRQEGVVDVDHRRADASQ